MNHCDFCGASTRNERKPGDELLCQSCRHDQAKRLYRPKALEAALGTALERLPAMLHERLLKAYDLCISGYVKRNGDGWIVKSQSGERVYRITAAGCQCEDSWHGAPVIMGKPACKHQCAVWLEIKADELIPRRFDIIWHGGYLYQEKTPKRSDNYYRWCEKCGDSTKHGFGLGCLRCLGWQNREAA